MGFYTESNFQMPLGLWAGVNHQKCFLAQLLAQLHQNAKMRFGLVKNVILVILASGNIRFR